MMQTSFQNQAGRVATEFLQFAQNKLETILFFLLLLFLPTQFGKHFWPLDAFVLGQRIDYLSPTLYTTDILLFFLFVVFIFKKRKIFVYKNKKYYILFSPLSPFIIVGLVASVSSVLFSQNHIEGLYGLFKVSEIAFLTYYTCIVWRRVSQTVLFAFICGIISESVLAILEFFHQGSLNGIFYFLGERMFSSTTPGIANASISGQLIMRPYATFSHPNVLAGYLVIGMTILLFFAKQCKKHVGTLGLFITLIIGTLALFLTLSRVAILVWFLVIGFLFFYNNWWKFEKKHYLVSNLFLTLVILTVIIFSPVLPRFTQLTLSDQSVVLREQLATDATAMFFDHPLFGIGMHNFLIALPSYDSYRVSVFTIQPVHNIFLLVASETGFLGAWVFISFFIWIYLRLFKIIKLDFHFSEKARRKESSNRNDKEEITYRKNQTLLSLTLITEVILLGSFDHYFLTLQQGQLLFGFIIGICLSIALTASLE